MKKLFLGIFIFFCSYVQFTPEAFAQQDQLYYTYMFNPLALNPAYAGSSEITSLSIVRRMRSIAIQNTPSSSYFSMDFPVSPSSLSGIGLQAFYDNFSVGSAGVYLSYAYRMNVGETGTVSIGFQSGFTQVRSTNFLSVNEFKINLGTGVYYRNPNAFIGIGIPSLLKTTSSASGTGGTTFRYEFYQPVFVTAGYTYPINDRVDLKAGIVIRNYLNTNVSGKKTVFDYNAMAWFRNKFGLGLWYQNTGSEFSDTALQLSAEVNLGSFRFGYAYDFKANDGQRPVTGTNPITGGISTANGLHTLLIRYGWDSGNGKMATPRYF